MSRFKKGEIPIPDYDASDTRTFNQKVEFYNDVYVYGDLYADIKSEDILFADDVELTSLTLKNNLFVTGFSTFFGPVDVDYLTVYQRHNVGASGTVFVAISSTSDLDGQTGGRVGIGSTQPDARFQVGVGDTSFVVTDLGLVGIGTTQPVGKFQVNNDCFIVTEDPCAVGIGTTQPVDKFQINEGNDSFVVTGIGTVGIGTTSVGGDWTVNNTNYNGSTQGELKLDIDGSVHIDRNIYDSQGSPGVNGYYLQRDGNGIRWNQVSPVDLDGIRVQENGVDLPIGGTSQLFSHINFVQINSNGTGVDNIVASPNSSNPTTVADIQSKDFWGYNGNNIYRMSNVGIQNNNPSSTLDITGTVHATGAVDFDTTLNVDGQADFNSTVIIDGQTTIFDSVIIQSDNEVFNINNNAGQIKFSVDTDNGNTLIEGTLNVNGATIIDDTLNVTQGTDLDATLNVDGGTTLNSTLDVDGGTTLNNTLDVDGGTTLNSTLDVDGGTTLNNTLDVDGLTTFNNTNDASSTTNASVQIDGGVGIVKKLFVGDDTKILGTTESTSKDTGSLVVEGGIGAEKNLNIGGSGVIAGRLDVDSTTESTNTTSGAAVIDGGLGLAKNINIGGSGVIAGRLDVNDTTQSSSTTTGAAVIDGGLGVVKNLNVGQDAKILGNLELDAKIFDFFNNSGVGVCKTDYRLSSFDVSGVGIGVSWRPSGVQTKRTIWVTKNGCDTNSGLLEGDAKYTIGAAAAVAQVGDTIRVRSGNYVEDNPIGLREDVAINGEDLRLVLLIPKNKNKDFFHVRRGCLIENLSFTGASMSDDHSNCGAVAFPPIQANIDAGLEFQAVTGFTDVGPADEGSAGRWRSPYVRNCTNFMTKSIGMKINGDHANAKNSGTNNLGQDLKSMVCDSFTQYNEAGIGVSLSNNAYAQLVSIFTICCEVGIAATSGGQCDLTNSNSSFGNIGLKADGFGDIEFDGELTTAVAAGDDKVISKDTKDFNSPRSIRTPFDGQGAYFHLDMSDYDDTPSTASVTSPLELVRSIKITNGGNDGEYSASSPPIITLNEAPLGPESILPEFSPNVSAAGTITSVDVLNSGRNFLPTQNLTVSISGGGNATATVDMDPILFTVSEATDAAAVTGITTVTFNEFLPYSIVSGTKIELVRLSRIITSSHSFEYIGAGTDINTANPFQAGSPVPENEVVAINGGQVPFTSTDQKGNFRIGDGLTIDQTTSTIRGRDFNRAIQAQLTPLILALN